MYKLYKFNVNLSQAYKSIIIYIIYYDNNPGHMIILIFRINLLSI